MLTAIKINKMRRLPATFKQQFTTKQLKSNSIINLYYYYLNQKINFPISLSFPFMSSPFLYNLQGKIPFCSVFSRLSYFILECCATETKNRQRRT